MHPIRIHARETFTQGKLAPGWLHTSDWVFVLFRSILSVYFILAPDLDRLGGGAAVN